MDTTERKDGDTPSGNIDQPPAETTESSGGGAELDDLLGSLGDAIDQLKEEDKPSDAEPAAGPVAELAVAPVTVEPVAAEQNPVSAPPAVASEESVAAAAEPIVAPAPVAVDGVSEIDLAGLEAGVQASTVLPVVGDEIQPIQVEEPAAAVAVTAAAPEEVAAAEAAPAPAAEAAPAPAAEAEKEKPVVVVDEDGAVDKGMTETLRMLDSGLVDPNVADKKGKDADKDGNGEEPDIASLTGTSRRKLVKVLTIGGTAVAAALVGAYLVSEYKPETAAPVTPKPEPQASAPVPAPQASAPVPTPEPTLAPVAPAPISELTAACCFKYVQPGPTGRAKMPEAECDGNNFEVGNFSNDGKPVDGQVATTLKGTINGKTVECETNMDANAFKALYRGETTATTFDCEPARCTVVQ